MGDAFRAALLVALLPASGAGQSFTGRVVDEATGQPVPTAAVHLLDAEGGGVRSVLADQAGRYVVEIPASGEYRLAAERFGYLPTRSPLLAVTADRDYPVELSVRPEPIPVRGMSVTVRNERVERWLTQALHQSPYSVPGFRLIQGERLRQAIARSDDGIEMARWLYLPVFNRLDRLCIGAYTGRGCLHLYVDGRYLSAELLETVEIEEVVQVIVLPPALHLLTRRFDFPPFTPAPFAGREYGATGDTLR